MRHVFLFKALKVVTALELMQVTLHLLNVRLLMIHDIYSVLSVIYIV